MGRFATCFAELEDPRDDNARHDLHEILMIALCAMLCGAEDCSDMAAFGRAKERFLRQFLTLRHGIPSHDTFSRVFRLLDPAQFHACFLRFMQDFAQAAQGVIAIDGKTLRRSFDRATQRSPLHLVGAWAVGCRLLLGQLATDEKSNEITAVPRLLEMISLKGAIVTADALNCQRAIAAKVVEKGGDYVLALKGNQSTLFDDVRLYLDDPAHAPSLAVSEPDVDADHGRIETRQAFVCTTVDWLAEHDWPGLAAIGKLVRTRELKGVDQPGGGLLPAQHAALAGSLRPSRPRPLGHREQPALGAGRDYERGPEPEPQGPCAAKPCAATPMGAEHLQARRFQGLHEGQAQARRLE